jgi:hypothetical protein
MGLGIFGGCGLGFREQGGVRGDFEGGIGG